MECAKLRTDFTNPNIKPSGQCYCVIGSIALDLICISCVFELFIAVIFVCLIPEIQVGQQSSFMFKVSLERPRSYKHLFEQIFFCDDKLVYFMAICCAAL